MRSSWQPHNDYDTVTLGSPVMQCKRYSDPLPILQRNDRESSLSHARVRVVSIQTYHDHCAYLCQVDTGAERFVLSRRYSDFRLLRDEVVNTLRQSRHCCVGACNKVCQELKDIKFPHRRLQFSKAPNIALARQRSVHLEAFLNALLHVYQSAARRELRSCSNNKCAVLHEIFRFLELEVENPVFLVNEQIAHLVDVSKSRNGMRQPQTRARASTGGGTRPRRSNVLQVIVEGREDAIYQIGSD